MNYLSSRLFCVLCVLQLACVCVVHGVGTTEGGYEPAGGDTMRQLNDLIEVTENNLNHLRDLRQQFTEYYKIKAKYLLNQQDRDQILRMVKAASQLQHTIEAQNLSYAFDPETLKELSFFSQIANKKGLTRP